MEMKTVIETIEKRLSYEELQHCAKTLDMSYNTFMLDSQVWALLYSVFPSELRRFLNQCKALLSGHALVNAIIMRYYHCEKAIKYHLIKEFKDQPDEVGLLEFTVNRSRIDVGRINGESFCYEIKTEYDNLHRLQKQLQDYQRVFEYTYVAVHSKHVGRALELVPETCGIIEFECHADDVFFNVLRPANKSNLLDPDIQLANLSSQDIKYILQKLGYKDIPNLRKNRECLVRESCCGIDFNTLFKEAIKNKYQGKWKFLVTRFDQIQPIDIQAFYTSNLDPYWIYYKNSSIV